MGYNKNLDWIFTWENINNNWDLWLASRSSSIFDFCVTWNSILSDQIPYQSTEKSDFFTPRNLIFSSQNPNSTFHSRSQVKIGFFFFSKPKCRFFTPRYFLIFVAFWEFCGIFGLLWFFLTCVVLDGSYGIFWLLWYFLTFVSHEIQFYPTKFLNNRQKNRISILLPRYEVNIRT